MTSIAERTVLPATHHILVVDDDDRIRNLLGKFLHQQGFTVSLAQNAEETKQVLDVLQVDMIILDIMLPGISGLEILKTLRHSSRVPVMMLTALEDMGNKLEGLGHGADDYLTKPFDPQELVLRIRNILQRSQHTGTPIPESFHKVRWGDWLFSIKEQKLWYREAQVMLSKTELHLLTLLAQHLGSVVSRERLSVLAGIYERSIDVQITRLRQKIEPNPKQPLYLKTVRGKGYYLDAMPVVE